MPPNLQAVVSAISQGSDLRTIHLADGSPVRLLTYRTPPESGYGAIQLGLPLIDQAGILSQFLTGMLAIGGISILGLGFGSWWMAHRSLSDSQKNWEMQQTFIANASHELRTPLTLIRASSEVALRQADEGTPQHLALSDVIGECDHMAQLVDDLLLLSRLDSKQLKLDQKSIILMDLMAEVRRQFEHLAVERKINLKTYETRAEVLGDRTRLRQVLLILLDNALRHTPDGGWIEMRVAPAGRYVRVDITDNGEGISPEHLEHVFDRFYQVSGKYGNGKAGSSGLGLSIAKGLVEVQDGSISIESEPGKGTRVSILLPSASTQKRSPLSLTS